jgi:hypothetical protein
MGGSGAELAAQLANQQNAAQRQNETSLDVAGMAQKRAFDALAQRGRMAGDIRGQDFGERFRTGSARDEINRYNADQRNKAKYFNSNLEQQRFDNDMNIRRAQAGADRDMAGMYAGNAADTKRTASNIGAALSGGMQGLAGQAQADDDRDYERKMREREYAGRGW